MEAARYYEILICPSKYGGPLPHFKISGQSFLQRDEKGFRDGKLKKAADWLVDALLPCESAMHGDSMILCPSRKTLERIQLLIGKSNENAGPAHSGLSIPIRTLPHSAEGMHACQTRTLVETNKSL
ncbi:hypothetical protein ACJ73_00036 [Blastomyces percursus]|uniref:Uncharacterized protein n=1 Tax=Blastomyces percursus TaxID=1658174 RepID=A0A1J9QKE8_9EURO|nr:hypothetical protein ACJ73_00036 [Blastomyces percursus]